MTTEDQVTFRLRYFCRYDEQVRAFVGYIPRFQLYAQSASEEGLEKAATAIALRFLMVHADRGTFGQLMQESRMLQISDREVEDVVANEDSEFVSISGYKECPHRIEITLSLPIAAQTAIA